MKLSQAPEKAKPNQTFGLATFWRFTKLLVWPLSGDLPKSGWASGDLPNFWFGHFQQICQTSDLATSSRFAKLLVCHFQEICQFWFGHFQEICPNFGLATFRRFAQILIWPLSGDLPNFWFGHFQQIYQTSALATFSRFAKLLLWPLSADL